MAELGSSVQADVRGASPLDGAWLPVPAAFFRGGGEPSFVLFDARRRVADLRMARTVYVSPGDFPELRLYLQRRLSALGGSTPEDVDARAWGLHRALIQATGLVMPALVSQPEQRDLLRPVIDVARLAADWVPATPT